MMIEFHFSTLVSFFTHFWIMIFDLKLGIIKDCAMYVVSLDQLHSLMCFAIIKSAVFAICPFTRFSLTMHNCSLKIEIESQKSKLYLSNHGRPYFYICKSNMIRGKDTVGYVFIIIFKKDRFTHVPYLVQNNKSSVTILEKIMRPMK